MDLGRGGREGYCEGDEQMINKSGKFPYSSSSASASASYSSPQYRGFFPSSNGRTGTEAPIYNHHHQRGSWYETQEETFRSYDGGTTTTAAATTPKFELMMDVSPPANHHHREAEDAGESQLALGNSGSISIQKEHMFDKVVTPSDVGKLNRLVIPKQHAEKYFPLDSSTNEKGLLLNFEDRTGKPWRFRYSYWNSSQSYVMTKGWSRFVKEKKLDAGDIVSFQRGVGELAKDRLYIDWRRRPNASDASSFPNALSIPHNFAFHRSIPWSPMFFRPPPPPPANMPYYPQPPNNNINFHPNQARNSYRYNNTVNPSFIYLRSAAAAAVMPQEEVRLVQVQEGGGGGIEPMVFDSVPVVHGKAAGKRMRLFGVNMECGVSSELDHESNAAAMAASQSSSTIPFTLQSRLYNGIPLQTDFLNKGKSSSSMSLDLDI